MRLLIADLVRRQRGKASFFAVILAVMLGANAAIGDFSRTLWASLGVAFAIGPMTLWQIPRSIWYLPLAKRDVWQAGWLVATVGATVLTTAVKLAAMLVPYVRESFDLASVTLSSVYDFAYAGLGCGLVVLTTRPLPANGPQRVAFAVLKGMAEFILPLGLSVAMVGTIAIPNLLPAHWTEMTPRAIVILIAALGLAAASYFHVPVPPPTGNRISPQLRAKAATSGVEPRGLSGLPRLFVHEAAWTLMVGGALVGGSALFVLVAAKVAQAPEGLSGLMRSILVHLDERGRPEPGAGLDASILLIVFAVFATGLAARFPSMMRHLRVLPLGAARLNALLIAWPAVIWLAGWMALQALHYLVLGEVLGFSHADVLVGLIGISAIVQAMTLRLSGFFRFLAFATLAVVVPLLLFLDAAPPAASVAAGLGGLVAAVALNHRALARTSTYAPLGPTIGGVQTL